MRPTADHQKASTPAPARCPKCRSALPADAPEGLCPVCAFRGALELEPGAARPLVPEQQLPRQFGEYQLLEEIARDGMGIVYQARQLRACFENGFHAAARRLSMRRIMQIRTIDSL